MLRRYFDWRARSSGRHRLAGAEQAFEQRARIEDRRQRLRLAAPCQVVGVSAGVAGIAIARLARIFHAEFERREARLLADLVGDDLVEGDAVLDFDQRLLDLNAGEVRAGAAAVIARAIEQRAAGVVGQVAELDDVVFERLQRLQRARQFLELAFVGRDSSASMIMPFGT